MQSGLWQSRPRKNSTADLVKLQLYVHRHEAEAIEAQRLAETAQAGFQVSNGQLLVTLASKGSKEAAEVRRQLRRRIARQKRSQSASR